MILVFFFFWSSLMLGCLPSVETAISRFVAKFWRRWWSTAVGSSRLRRRRKNKFIRKTGEVEQWLEMMLQFWMQTSQFSITRANRCCCCCCRLSYEFCQNLNQWLHSANATTDRNFVRMHQKHGSLIKNWNKKKKTWSTFDPILMWFVNKLCEEVATAASGSINSVSANFQFTFWTIWTIY